MRPSWATSIAVVSSRRVFWGFLLAGLAGCTSTSPSPPRAGAFFVQDGLAAPFRVARGILVLDGGRRTIDETDASRMVLPLSLSRGHHAVEMLVEVDVPCAPFAGVERLEIRSHRWFYVGEAAVGVVARVLLRGDVTTPFSERLAIEWRTSGEGRDLCDHVDPSCVGACRAHALVDAARRDGEAWSLGCATPKLADLDAAREANDAKHVASLAAEIEACACGEGFLESSAVVVERECSAVGDDADDRRWP